MNLLLAEPDPKTREAFMHVLASEGFSTTLADESDEVLDLAKNYAFDAIVVALPHLTGCATVRRLRDAGVKTPVFLIAGADDHESEIAAFLAGADDFLRKPLHKRVFVSRLQSLIRRSRGCASPVISVGRISVDCGSKSISVNGVPVHLTGTEFQLIEFLAQRQGATLTKTLIMDQLYGGMDEPELKIVDVFICKIRRKLRIHGAHDQLETMWGRGYRLVAEPSGAGYRPGFSASSKLAAA